MQGQIVLWFTGQSILDDVVQCRVVTRGPWIKFKVVLMVLQYKHNSEIKWFCDKKE